jgi:hypothetical protein
MPEEGAVTGVTGRRADEVQYSRQAVDVFPRFDGQGGVPATDRDRFQVEATELFGHLRDGVEQKLFSDRQPAEELPINTTISVPGVYDERDREDVANALDAVGIKDAAVVRAPVGTAATRLPSLSQPTTVVAVEIGYRWCNAAVVKADPDAGTLSVQTRVVEPDVGRARLDRALAEQVLQAEQSERNHGIEPTPDGFDRLKSAAHEAINDLVSEDSVALSVTDLSEVNLEKGTPPITIERQVDEAMVISALEDIHHDLSKTLSALLDRHDLTAEEVEDVVVAGSGTVPGAVRTTVGEFFHREIAPPEEWETPLYQPAYGAAIIGYLRNSHEPVQRETTDGAIGLRLPTSDGQLEFEELIAPTATTGQPHEIQLKPTVPDQKSGSLAFATRHQATGELVEYENWGVFGIPHLEGEAQPFAVDVVAADRAENIVNVRPLSETVESRRISDPPAPEVDTAEAEWLVDSETDPSEVTLPESEDDVEPVSIDEPIAESFEETSPKQTLETLLGVRYELWKFAEQDNPASPSDLRDLLKRYDTGLLRINVDMISPAEGERQDRNHRIWDTEPSPRPDGEILEVQRPGYTVDGYVEKPADVIVSKGEPETEDTTDEATDAVNPEEETEETADDEGAESSGRASDTTAQSADTDEAETREKPRTTDEASADSRGNEETEPADTDGGSAATEPRDDSQPAEEMDDDLQLRKTILQSSESKVKVSLQVSDPEGEPVEGAHIDITRQGRSVFDGPTDAGGRRNTTLNKDKKYGIHVTKPDGDEGGKMPSITEEIYPGEDLS